MNVIRIGVCVPLAAAVAAGRSEFGYTSVELSDADVAALSADARTRLRAWTDADGGSREDTARRLGLVGIYDGRWTCEVDVLRADAPSTLAAIEAVAEIMRAKAAQELAESEGRIAEALAQPDAAWIVSLTPGGSYASHYYTTEAGAYATTRTGRSHGPPGVAPSGPRGCYLSEAERHDPRITERVARVTADVLPGLLTTHAQRYAEWLAGLERAEADQRTRAAAWSAAARDYVIRWVPEYAQAARDGCDVRRLARETSVDTCTEMLHSHDLETVEAYGEPEAHPRPHQRAYDALGTVRRWMDLARSEEIAAASAELVDRYTTRIVRADTCEEDGCTAGKRTCVEVSLHYVDGQTEEIYVYADGALPHVVHETSEAV